MLAERRRSGGPWSVLPEELGRTDQRHAFRARPPLGGGQLLRRARVVCVADEREDAVEGRRDDLSREELLDCPEASLGVAQLHDALPVMR